MAAELTKRYSYCSDQAMEAAHAGRLPAGSVIRMLKTLDLARDVSAGTATLLAMGINEDVLRNSSGPEPQISRTGLFALQSLGQAANQMLDHMLEDLFDDLSQEANHG